MSSYNNEAPFNPVMFVHFRKRINVDLVHKLNQKMVKQAEENNGEQQKSQEKSLGEFPNQGRLILDATCAPADISYPRDLGLLHQGRIQTEKIIDTLYEIVRNSFKTKPRTSSAQSKKRIFGSSEKTTTNS